MTDRKTGSTPSAITEMCGSVWPDAALRTVGLARRVRIQHGEMLVLPRASRPRLLVPAERRAAARAIAAHGTPRSVTQRVARAGLVAAVRAGLGPALFPDRLTSHFGGTSLVDQLETVLGSRITVSVAITPARANRKPVLHLLDSRGRSVGYCKVGVTPLTDLLVSREADVLTALARSELQIVEAPRLLYRGQWHGHEVLVCSPLPTRRAHAASPDVLAAAMLELSKLELPGDPICDSYLLSLAARTRDGEHRASEHNRAAARQLADFGAALSEHPGSVPIGCAHGDWTPWNCGQLGNRLLTWDWERCRTGMPLGFDALHFALQQAVVERRISHAAAARSIVDRAPQLLCSWRLADSVARTLAIAYLLEIGLRYVVDDQRAAGGFGSTIEEWALPVISDHLGVVPIRTRYLK